MPDIFCTNKDTKQTKFWVEKMPKQDNFRGKPA
jgi:hypothetical protein